MFQLDENNRCNCHGSLVQEVRNNADFLLGWVVQHGDQYVEVTYRGLELVLDFPYGKEFTTVNAEDAHDRVWGNWEDMYSPGRPTYLDAVVSFLDHLTSNDSSTTNGGSLYAPTTR